MASIKDTPAFKAAKARAKGMPGFKPARSTLSHESASDHGKRPKPSEPRIADRQDEGRHGVEIRGGNSYGIDPAVLGEAREHFTKSQQGPSSRPVKLRAAKHAANTLPRAEHDSV